MALQTEIWINAVIERLFADNTFAARSIDHSQFVNNLTVHVPNAGAPSGVVIGRSTFPAPIGTRADVDLTYSMKEFTTDPIRLPHADQVELSYDKRESIIRQDRSNLAEKVHEYVLGEWITSAPALTPGTTEAKTILAAKKQFDKDDIPQEGRCLILDADTYNKLLDEPSDVQASNFLAGADPVRGVVAKYYGFDIYMRSKLDGTQKGLFWHENSVSRALGETTMFEDEKDPSYYGDILSFLVRAGGAVIRQDTKGVLKY